MVLLNPLSNNPQEVYIYIYIYRNIINFIDSKKSLAGCEVLLIRQEVGGIKNNNGQESKIYVLIRQASKILFSI